MPFTGVTPSNDPRETTVGIIGLHPSTGDPVIVACGLIPVADENEELQVRQVFFDALISALALLVTSIILVAVEGSLGRPDPETNENPAGADDSRIAMAIDNGEDLAAIDGSLDAAAALEDSNSITALAGSSSVEGAGAFEAALALPVIELVLALLLLPVMTIGLLWKNRSAVSMSGWWASLVTVLVFAHVLALGLGEHLQTRFRGGLTAAYLAHAFVAALGWSRLAIALRSLSSNASFFLFAKSHVLDLHAEVLLEMERMEQRRAAGLDEGGADGEAGGDGDDADSDDDGEDNGTYKKKGTDAAAQWLGATDSEDEDEDKDGKGSSRGKGRAGGTGTGISGAQEEDDLAAAMAIRLAAARKDMESK